GDDEAAEVGAARGVDALRDDLQRVDVEAGVGLVEDRVAGLEDEELEDLGALLLAAGEALVQVALEDRLVPVQLLHGLLELLVELHDADLVALGATGVQGQAQEVRDRDAGDLHRVLEGEVEPGTGPLVGLHLEDRLAFEEDVAARHLVLRVAGDDLRERRLARAVRAHERVHLAARDDEVHALEDLVAVDDAGTQVTDLQR